MSHTPGDWKVDKAIRLGYSIIAISPDGISVVVENIDNEGRYGAIGESDDALLMAAAPAMLEALEEVMGELDVEGLPCPLCGRDLTIGHRRNCIWHVVESAVKKARDEE